MLLYVRKRNAKLVLGTDEILATGQYATLVRLQKLNHCFQISSTFYNAFSELLDVYQRIGENFPLVQQYRELFPDNLRIGKVLVYIYEDMLNFHKEALHYFQQPCNSMVIVDLRLDTDLQ